MGRKRDRPLKPGDKTTFYIPKTISEAALKWINSDFYLSTELIKLVEEKVKLEEKKINLEMISTNYASGVTEDLLRRIMREELSRITGLKDEKENKAETIESDNKKKRILKTMKL